MKKRVYGIILLGCLAVIAGLAKATTVFYQNIATETSLSYSKSYVVDMSSRGADRVAVQVTLGTQTTTASTFTNGSESTFTVSITSWPFLLESRSSATITVTSNTAMNGGYAMNTVSVASNPALIGNFASAFIFVSSNIGVNGATVTFVRSVVNIVGGSSPTAKDPFAGVSSTTIVLASSATWSLGASSIAATINLANALNSVYGISASTISNSTIQVTSIYRGAAYNYYTIGTSTVSLVVNGSSFTTGSSSFTAGSDPVTLTFNYLADTITLTAGVQFVVGPSSQTTSTSIANALSYRSEFMVNAASSDVQGASVTIVVKQVGQVFNGYSLISSSPSALQIGTTFFFGGADRVQFSINGVVFISSVNFFTDVTATGTVNNIQAAISSVTGLGASTFSVVNPLHTAPIIISSAMGGLVNLTSISTGSAYTYPLFTSSQSAVSLSYVSFTTSGSTFSSIRGGRDVPYLVINGIVLRQGRDWFAAFSNSDTAKSISSACFTNQFLFNTQMTTWTVQGSTGIVVSTSISNGTFWNFNLYSSSNPVMTLSGNTVYNSTYNYWASSATGGTNATYSSATDIISLPNNTLGTGSSVLYTTGPASGGTFLTPLTYAVTYYVILVDSTNIKLAVTSSGAIAGIGIDLTSLSTQAVANTFTLTPTAPIGSPTGWWQVSNDGLNWFNLSVPSTTLASPYISTTTFNDLGVVNAKLLRFNTTMPTGAGSYTATIAVHGKN